MTKDQLKADMESRAGWIATIKDTIKDAFEDENGQVYKIRSYWSVESVNELGILNFSDVQYSLDVLTGEAKYTGNPPTFQRSPSQEESNRAAMYAYFASKGAWKAYTVEYLDATAQFAVLTTIQKDVANKYYTQRVIVTYNSGFSSNNIEKDTYIPT